MVVLFFLLLIFSFPRIHHIKNTIFGIRRRILYRLLNPFSHFIKSLKLQIGEDADYDKVIARYKTYGFGAENVTKDMIIVPVNFNKEHKAMLGHCKMILEHEPRKIAIIQTSLTSLLLF